MVISPYFLLSLKGGKEKLSETLYAEMKTIIVNTTVPSMTEKTRIEDLQVILQCLVYPFFTYISLSLASFPVLFMKNLQEAVQLTTRSLTQVNENTSPFHVYFILF